MHAYITINSKIESSIKKGSFEISVSSFSRDNINRVFIMLLIAESYSGHGTKYIGLGESVSNRIGMQKGFKYLRRSKVG